jgi:hypothetical protein
MSRSNVRYHVIGCPDKSGGLYDVLNDDCLTRREAEVVVKQKIGQYPKYGVAIEKVIMYDDRSGWRELAWNYTLRDGVIHRKLNMGDLW